ncbi:MAG: hypothetical protein ACXU9D_24865, partial [Xanthobacteraceae bacterium]
MGAQLRALLALEGAVRADAQFSAQAMVAVSVHRRPARILTVIVGNPGLRRSIDRLSSSRGRLKEDAMRSIVLGAIVAAG